jgi:hypothetical protein
MKRRRVAAKPLSSCYAPLCVFSKQDNALIGWPDAISAHTFVNPEAYQTSLGIEFDQALNAHAAGVIEDAVSSLEVSERCYDAFCPCQDVNCLKLALSVLYYCVMPA